MSLSKALKSARALRSAKKTPPLAKPKSFSATAVTTNWFMLVLSSLLCRSTALFSERGNRRAVLVLQTAAAQRNVIRIVIQNNMCYRSGIMSSKEKTISFRAVAEEIEALDSLAAKQERPRSYLINEAIANYIELHAYQDALVRKGLEEMRKGRVVSHEQVLKGLKRTGRARQ